MPKKIDFFISYNNSDRFWAGGIRELLLESGRTVRMQDPDFQAGSNFILEMHEGLRQAKRMIAVLSPDYLTSRFCSSEWAAKFAEDPMGSQRLLIFVKVRDCQLDGLLSQIVHIDLTGLEVEAAKKEFLEQLIRITESATDSPPKRTRPKKPKRPPSNTQGDPVITQNSKGSHATNIGIQNITTERYAVHHQIQPGPEHISPAQRTIINDRLTELGEREAMVAVAKQIPEGPRSPEQEALAKEITSRCFRNLRADFKRQVNDGQPYQLLPKERFEAALQWIAQRKAIKRPSLRRTNNELWRRDFETIIWSSMRARKWNKQDVYDFALEKQFVNDPITSLKELGEQKLQRLAQAIKVRRAKSK